MAGLGIGGAYTALAVAGPVVRPVGPFEAALSLEPARHGESVLAVPPLGDLRFDTHSGPVRLVVQLREVEPAALTRLAADPQDLSALGDGVRHDLRGALLALVLQDSAIALTGAALAGLLVLRQRRAALGAGATALVVLVASAGTAASTFEPAAVQQPEFTGVLAYAPVVIGDTRDVMRRLDDYSQQLGRLVTNVSTLYEAASTLPTYADAADTIRLLHVSDLHLSPSAFPLVKAVAQQFDVDLVVDTGDVADHGSSVEDGYVSGIGTIGVPYVYVRGNHDSAGTEAAVRAQPGAVVLADDRPVEVAGLTLLGEADPRFTPDKTTGDDHAPREELLAVGNRLRRSADRQTRPPDVVAVHDPVSAGPLLGHVPLVLAGHTHARSVTVTSGTRLMVEGSTGGAGLRGLEGAEPTPVEMSVLYLDRRDGSLGAWDEITLGGLGLADARIRRQVADPPPTSAAAAPTPAPVPGG